MPDIRSLIRSATRGRKSAYADRELRRIFIELSTGRYPEPVSLLEMVDVDRYLDGHPTPALPTPSLRDYADIRRAYIEQARKGDLNARNALHAYKLTCERQRRPVDPAVTAYFQHEMPPKSGRKRGRPRRTAKHTYDIAARVHAERLRNGNRYRKAVEVVVEKLPITDRTVSRAYDQWRWAFESLSDRSSAKK